MQADSRVDVSVLIVNWNTSDLLRSCLQSVYSRVLGISYEVIVVDNGSTDGSQEMVACDFPNARLIRNSENRGFAAANNQAIRLAAGRHLLLLNSDAAVEAGSVERMAFFLDGNAAVGVVGGRLRHPDGTFQSSFADFPGLGGELMLLTGLSRWLLPPSYPSYPEARSMHAREVEWVGGAYMMVRRKATETVGLLDEDYFMYAEEMDWCLRMHEGGWKVWYLPEAEATHWLGGSAQRVPERRRLQIYWSKWLFLRKHGGEVRALLFRHAVRAISLVKLIGWTVTGIAADNSRRQRTREHVASYRFLLANF
jgi:GT2 family glycosyltransferase